MSESCCGTSVKHPDHTSELNRLSRIAGQVDGVKRMVGERRYCPDILIQLRAIRSAIHALEARILETHLDACVTDAFNSDDVVEKKRKVEELKLLYRKYSTE